MSLADPLSLPAPQDTEQLLAVLVNDPLVAAVLMDASAQPWVGNRFFGMLVSNAPKTAPGFLIIGGPFPAAGVKLPPPLGATLYANPVGGVLLPFASDAAGRAFYSLPLTGVTKGLRVFMQSVWVNNAACVSKDQLSASVALDVTVQ